MMELTRKKILLYKLLTNINFKTYYRIYKIIHKYVFNLYYPINSIQKNNLKLTMKVVLIESLMYFVDQTAEIGKNESFASEHGRNFNKLNLIKNNFLKFLHVLDIKTDGLEDSIEKGERYIRLENKILCGEYKNVTEEEIREAVELRSSDIRLLHMIIINELGIRINDTLLSTLWHLETITEFENDLIDYKRDRANGNFNILIMYENFYGRSLCCDKIKNELLYQEECLNTKIAHLAEKEKEIIRTTLFNSHNKINEEIKSYITANY